MKARRLRLASALPLLLIALAASAASCATKAPAASAADAPDAASPAETWTLLGPYTGLGSGSDPTGMRVDHLAAYGGEAALARPGAAFPSGIPSAEAKESAGQVDFRSAFPVKTWAVAYAYRDFDSPGGDAVLRVGSDDGIRLWLNGEILLDDQVMRALDPDASLIRVRLAAGKNRIMAKVDQGTGEWALSVRLSTPAGEEARAASRTRIGLTAAQSGPPDGERASFIVSSDPPFALDLPIDYRVEDSAGGTVASGRCALATPVRVRLPGAADGLYRLFAQPAPGAALASRFEGAEASALIVKGDSSRVLAEAADRAEAAALGLAATAARSADAGGAGAFDDTAATLEFLAARLRGSLHPSLEADSLRLQAAAFAEDLIAALRAGPSGPAALRGYRQMAYRSAIDGTLQPYSLYLPRGYDPSRKYSLVVSLHGYTDHDYDGGSHLARERPEDFIVLSAYGRGDMHYRSIGEQDVLDVMDRIEARYSVDPDRVYLTGISMGGLGTWRIGQMYPDRFAAIAPFCGWTGLEWIENLRSLPVLAVHGDADPTVPISFDANAVSKMEKLGYDVRFDVLAGVGHDAWTGWRQARPSESIFDFFRSRVRNRSPERITAAIPYARYGSQYWITIDELDAGGVLESGGGYGAPPLPAPGSVDARRVSPSRIEISTRRVKALTLNLTLAGASPEGAAILVDGTRIKAPAGAASLSLSRAARGAWRVDAAPPPVGLPRHDGGGVADLFTRPLVIAFGTRDASRGPVLESSARALADWSWTQAAPIGVKTGRFVVKADFAVTEEDLTTKEILIIGNGRENSLAAQAAPSIDPYYRDGSVSLGGKDFPGSGLALLAPSPFAPRRLMGCFDLPASLAPTAEIAARWFRAFQFRLRNVEVSEAATYPGFCPDVMALTADPFDDEWSGWFDRNWEGLEGR